MNPILRALAAKYREYLKPFEGHTQAILDSRIVDHNLDVADPPTGWYVRYSSGKQECFGNVVVFEGDGSSTVKTGLLYYPAPFSKPPAVMGDAGGASWQYRVAPSGTSLNTPREYVTWRAERFDSGSWPSGSMYRLLYVAKGVWK